MNATAKKTIVAVISVIILFLIDQGTKILAVLNLNSENGGSDFVIWDGVFRFQYLKNYGAAFGVLQGKTIILMVITVFALVVFGWLFFRIPNEKRYKPLNWLLIFFVAGAIGNFIDRIRLGYVVDFLYFELIDFPIFNVADIYVTCSVIVLVFLVIFYYKEDDFNRIFPSKKKEGK